MASPTRQELLLTDMVNELLKPNLGLYGLASTNVKGEIKYGNTLSILEIAPVTKQTYSPNSDMTLTSNSPLEMSLKIDVQEYFDEYFDNVILGDMDMAYLEQIAAEVAYQIMKSVEDDIASKHADAGIKDATKLGTTAAAINVATATYTQKLLLAMSELMNNAGVPREGRFACVPAAMETQIRLAYTSLLNGARDNMVQTGVIPGIEGFNIITAPVLDDQVSGMADATGIVLAGVANKSFARAEKIYDMKVYKPERRNGMAVQAPYVYGTKCFRPDMTAVAYIKYA